MNEVLSDQFYEVYPGCEAQAFARDFLYNKRITLEAFCKNERIDPVLLPRLVSEVLTDWELAESAHHSRKEAVVHMVNHLRIKIRNEKRNNRQSTPDKYSARRGTDVGNHTSADYGGPF